MFFFMYSSYYGAINSLADGKQRKFRRFRVIAGVVAAVFFVGSALMMYFFHKGVWMYIVIVPMGFTLYFAMKLLIIPDVDMGIIKVMRPYNALIVGLCICMILRILSQSGSMLETVSSVCTGLLLALNYCDKLILLKDGEILDILAPKVDPLEKMERALSKVYGPISLLLCKNRSGKEVLTMLKEDAQ